MDVPSWHPANQDSDVARRLLMAPSASTARTEFKVMAGSSADTTTEAGRQFVSDLNGSGAVPYEGRGFFDTSDRLYLLEQKKIQEAQKNKRKAEEDAQLQSFRSTALKLQSQAKPSMLVPDVAAAGPAPAKDAVKVAEKKPLPAIVVIKPKKRSAAASSTAAESSKKLRPTKKQTKATGETKDSSQTTSSNGNTKADAKPDPDQFSSSPANAVSAAPKASQPAAKAPGGLLLGYSSSSDSDA